MNFQNADDRNPELCMKLVFSSVAMCFDRTNFAREFKTLFDHVNRITSGSWIEQSSNTIGYQGDSKGIYMGYLKNPTEIIMGPKCNHISILKGY